jgi:hypothetical protein
LSVSTFLTLVVIPAIFSWVDDAMLRLKGKKPVAVKSEEAPAKA